jgi:serine palmitoyltransferase
MPVSNHNSLKDGACTVTPALKVCVTSALSKKDVEKAGVTIRHAITKVMTRKTNNKLGLPAA